jgi:transposase
LAWIEHVNQPLFRAHLLKNAFLRLGDTIANHIEPILITLQHRLPERLAEAASTRIRLLTRRAFGFHSSKPLLALAILSFGGQRPWLPGRPG